MNKLDAFKVSAAYSNSPSDILEAIQDRFFDTVVMQEQHISSVLADLNQRLARNDKSIYTLQDEVTFMLKCMANVCGVEIAATPEANEWSLIKHKCGALINKRLMKLLLF